MASRTMGAATEEAPVKYESPYGTTPPAYEVPQSPLKRRFSDLEKEGRESEGKRQRIEVPETDDTIDLESIIAQATAKAEQSFTDSVLQGGPLADSSNAAQGLSAQLIEHRPITERTAGGSSSFSSDPQLYMRILSLPMLESLSTQILSTLAQGPYSETIKIITQPDSELGQAYATLKSLFDQTKKIYSQQKPFLSAEDLSIGEPGHRATIRTTNLATFVSSVFGGQDVGFYELNDHFINTFVPHGEELKKEPGMLYLNLKTQMYLSAVSQEEQEMTREEILDDLFPAALEEKLLARHAETPLTPSEVEVVNEAKARWDYLLNEPGDVDSISALSEKFAWEDFLKSLSAHLKSAYEPLIAPYMRRHALTAPPASSQSAAVGGSDEAQTEQAQELDSEDLDLIEQATQAATQAALQSVGYGQQHAQIGYGNEYVTQYPAAAVPYHTQSAPTQVLYEQARQAAVAKASPHSRRPGLPSQRRPWSTEEENALMAGLDQVKGPHWSQILALYGTKGSISEILKDRNQVQLKDKARNLKLFFLKSNIEVPYYLQCVTGELKTRAPSQAARKEAEERARLAGDEEQARFHGIMALTNGMQQNQSQSNDSSPAHVIASRENSPEPLRVTEDNPPGEEQEPVAVKREPFEDLLSGNLREGIAGEQ